MKKIIYLQAITFTILTILTHLLFWLVPYLITIAEKQGWDWVIQKTKTILFIYTMAIIMIAMFLFFWPIFRKIKYWIFNKMQIKKYGLNWEKKFLNFLDAEGDKNNEKS